MRVFAVLALVQFCVCEKVNFEKSLFSSSSEESSEEEDIKHGKLDINAKDLSNLELNKEADPLNKCLSIKNQNHDNCVIEVCTQKCTLLGEDDSGVEAEQNRCKWGCKLQVDAFKSAKKNYPLTKPLNLLGQSIDKCWRGCDNMNLINLMEKSTCVTGCNEMRKLQKSQLLMKKPEVQISSDSGEDLADDSLPVLKTYVLWNNDDGMFGAGDSDIFRTMLSIMNSVFSDIDSLDGNYNRYNNKGYQDDRVQLNVPSFNQKAKSEQKVYSKVEQPERWYSDKSVANDQSSQDWLKTIKQNVEHYGQEFRANLNSARTKEFLYYTLLIISMMMILISAYDICIKPRENHGTLEQDYEHLMKTKLPSYEECMRAEPCKVDLQVEVHAPTDVCEKKSLETN